VEYYVGDTRYRREVIASAPHQVILVRLTASKPGSLSFRAQLRGCRNQAHSNYGTDYFRMDGVGQDGLVLTGKSADYLGVEGAIRYRAKLRAFPKSGRMEVKGVDLKVEKADTVLLVLAAATNFVNYKDVSGDPEARVKEVLEQVSGKSAHKMFEAAIRDHRALFDRVRLELPITANSYLPTDRRMADYTSEADPSLASLCYNFGRYVLIASSREGTQPANLQGIWNEDMNPSWDSKYTTNINTEMNYWPVETGNLAECAEPLITMVKELTDQGAQVAREHYGAGGWVFHQNTDLWRVAAPMDGPCWGTFTTGGAWLCTHLYEHYLFNPDMDYLKEIYPVIKGAVEFFMDFLVEHPNGRWLVSSPSTSPENPPEGPGYRYFFDEVTGFYYFTTICYGSTIDMQILTDLFRIYGEMAEVLDLDREFAARVKEARGRLVPPLVGKDGTLQEWTEDYGQLEDKHRHFSHMYGLYPGNVISARNTPDLIDACKAVLEQRGDGGTGFSRAWKMALWARLYDGNRAARIFEGYIAEQSYPQLFAKCFTPLQIDGTQGVAAGITEMLIQSHEGVIDLLPALPDAWRKGAFHGVCTRGGFELTMQWEEGEITRVEMRSKYGRRCRINPGAEFKVQRDGRMVRTKRYTDGSLAFDTEAGALYTLAR
jgi:alpha-L-fucosidase 2